MLEIILLVVLTRKIGEICEIKGRKAIGYKILLVILWFAGELVGAIFGVLVTGGEGFALYVFALIGAGVGVAIAFLIAKNASSATNPEIPPYG